MADDMTEPTNSNEPNDSAANDTAAADDKVHVQIVLDRSGSMDAIAAATVDALNGFLAKQRKHPGMLRLSLADFDSQEPFRVAIDAIPIAEVVDLTNDDFDPRGGTPLFDAIGLAVERCDARVAADESEDQVLVILTDGLENASSDFTGPAVSTLLDARQEAGWTVLYLGANQDAFAVGADLGMAGGNVRDFVADDAGIKLAMARTAEAVLDHRSRSRSDRRTLNRDLFDRTERPES